ncbi:MAG: superoxide dismutase [Ni] [Phycisphaerae bacterium]|nr:superoxide dismutase [Ni] [Phycisphaerae bacterium]MDD5380084.1 superoxide dismutase [Ni] [Phycisphaerae bacterium]
MRTDIRRKLMVSILLLAVAAPFVYSHCQIPCGIYDDSARLAAIAENITTIEKAMKSIEELSAQQKPNMNQIVRWVNVKDEHAGDIAHIASYYFMAQRIKPAEKSDAAGYEKYIKQLTLLHEMIIYSMKSKQTTDLANVKKLRSLLADFRSIYLGKSVSGETSPISGQEHSH